MNPTKPRASQVVPTDTADRKIRILYVAGPGDVMGTYRFWRENKPDPSQVAWTYSGQFFDVARELDCQSLVVASCSSDGRLDDDAMSIRHQSPFSRKVRGIWYHLAEIGRCLRLSLMAVRFGADVAIVAEGIHWFAWTALSWTGVKVVPSLHCAFWPAGHRPQGPVRDLIDKCNGRFWRRHACATICVSPECENQIRQITTELRGPVYQARAQYDRELFGDVAPPSECRPFNILYAGRMERNKGIYDMLDAAEILDRRHRGSFHWEFCGQGSELAAFENSVKEKQLEHAVKVLGGLKRTAMADAYRRCHVVVVPTRTDFAEGLNKVSVEATLACRPVVTTSLAHADEVLGEAIQRAQVDDPASYADAIDQLLQSPELYARRCAWALKVREQFFDRSKAWGAQVRTILLNIRAQR